MYQKLRKVKEENKFDTIFTVVSFFFSYYYIYVFETPKTELTPLWFIFYVINLNYRHIY